MLRFHAGHMLLPSGRNVLTWFVRTEIRVPGAAHGLQFELKIDTGADYTVIPLTAATRLGLDPAALTRSAKPIPIRTASGHVLRAYLNPMEFYLEDGWFGWARWTGTVAFCDPEPRVACAGKVGFLEFLRFADKGPEFNLEPVDRFPGSTSCSSQ